jgi:hypothetical protein
MGKRERERERERELYRKKRFGSNPSFIDM